MRNDLVLFSSSSGHSGSGFCQPASGLNVTLLNHQGNHSLLSQLMAAPVIEGVRMPDDVSDVIVHRNGKFFSNAFIPGDSTVSIKLTDPRNMWVPFYDAIPFNFSPPNSIRVIKG